MYLLLRRKIYEFLYGTEGDVLRNFFLGGEGGNRSGAKQVIRKFQLLKHPQP